MRTTNKYFVDLDAIIFEMNIVIIPPENPKTMRISALSVIFPIKILTAPVVVGRWYKFTPRVFHPFLNRN